MDWKLELVAIPVSDVATIRRAKVRTNSLTNQQPCCLCSAKGGRPCFSPT